MGRGSFRGVLVGRIHEVVVGVACGGDLVEQADVLLAGAAFGGVDVVLVEEDAQLASGEALVVHLNYLIN